MRHLMKNRFMYGVAAAAAMTALGLGAQVATPSTSTPQQGSGAVALEKDSATSAFIQEAARGNDAEIAMAQVAERKAQNSKVKELAQMIQTDHEKANADLKGVAQAHGITLEQSLSKAQEKKLNELNQESGTAFDQDYVKAMLRDHRDDIEAFQKAAHEMQASDAKQYAENCLPTLRKHLRHSEAAARAVGVDEATISSLVRGTAAPMGGTRQYPESESGSGTSSH